MTGMLRLWHLVIDGTEGEAMASKCKAMSHKWMFGPIRS